MRGLDKLIRGLAMLAGCWGILILIGVPIGLVTHQTEVDNPWSYYGIHIALFIVGVYLTNLGYVAWAEYSPFVIRHVFGILTLLAFVNTKSFMNLHPKPKEPSLWPFMYLGYVLVLYLIHVVASKAMIRISFGEKPNADSLPR